MNLPFKNIILGIDPGTSITGYGIIGVYENSFKPIDYGCIRPPAKLSLSQRYKIIYESVATLIENFSPDVLAVEAQFVDKNPQTAIKLGMAKGSAVLAAAMRDIPVFEYPPSRAKQAVAGIGKASKIQVQKMVAQILSLTRLPEPFDAADALALALCHAFMLSRGGHFKYAF